MSAHTSLSGLLLALSLGGCLPVVEIRPDGAPEVFVATAAPAEALTAGTTLDLEGWVSHSAGLAVTWVEVGGLRVAPGAGSDEEGEAFAHDEWALSIPWENLYTLALQQQQQQQQDTADAKAPLELALSLEVTATDVAGTESAPVALEISVARELDPGFDDLALTVLYPALADYLPADGSQSAVALVTAGAETVGATIALSADGQAALLSDTGETVTTVDLTLREDASGGTSVWAFVTPPSGLTSLGLTAAPDGQAGHATAQVAILEAPTVTPGSLTMTAGTPPFPILVRAPAVDFAPGAVTCYASLDRVVSEVWLSLDDRSVSFSEVMLDSSSVQFLLESTPELEESVTVWLACTDLYGQETTASFTVEPREPSEASQGGDANTGG